MRSTSDKALSRRGLGSLLVAAPMAAKAVQPPKQSASSDASQARSTNSARLKSVVLPRETEPSFRFEP
jgi:hypothetical protein